MYTSEMTTTVALLLLLTAHAYGQNDKRFVQLMAQNVSQSQSSTVASKGTAAGAAPQIAPGTIIPAELAKTLDAKKAKANDEVVAKTAQDLLSHGQIIIPRESKVIGHVTEVKARSKTEPQSVLGIVFDRLLLKDGSTMPLQVAVQAIRGPMRSASTTDNEMGGSAGLPSTPGRNLPDGMDQMGGARSYPNSSDTHPNIPGPTPGRDKPANASTGGLSSSTQGVVGIAGLTLTSSAQGSVFSSTSQNVHLDSGTQMLLLVNKQ
jgi:hypothetical protein